MPIRFIMWTKTFAVWLCFLMIAGSEEGCRRNRDDNQKESLSNMSKPTIAQVQEKCQWQWMSLPGVVAVGIGAVGDTAVIKVFVSKKTPALEQKIPKKVEGYSVVIEESGEIRVLERN